MVSGSVSICLLATERAILIAEQVEAKYISSAILGKYLISVSLGYALVSLGNKPLPESRSMFLLLV